MAPELWRSSQRRLILPQKMEDLEKPEYLEEIKGKINKMKRLKDLLDANSITQAEYLSRKAKILLGM
ncbi:MAG: SHOCT domain-containing protein [Methanothrix sp.]|nr:SHOCT domain-containing protein [Methanothrix sp.]